MERLSDIINSSSQRGSSSTATETSESETDTDDTSEFQRQSGYILTLYSFDFYLIIKWNSQAVTVRLRRNHQQGHPDSQKWWRQAYRRALQTMKIIEDHQIHVNHN